MGADVTDGFGIVTCGISVVYGRSEECPPERERDNPRHDADGISEPTVSCSLL
jgi:hypothetical protein